MMRKSKIWGCLSLMAVLLVCGACSDDEDGTGADPVALPLSAYVIGNYTGTLTMSFAYGTQEYEGKTVSITSNKDDANYVDLAFSDAALGTLKDMTHVAVAAQSDGSHTLVETEGVLTMPLHSDGEADYACLASGEISGDQQAFVITFFMPAVMGGTTYTLVPAE